MAYRVEFTFRAVRDLEILYMEKKVVESLAAARWYNGLAREGGKCARNTSSALPCRPGGPADEAKAAAPALRQEASRLPGHL